MDVEKVIGKTKKALKDFLAPERFVLAICLQAIFRRLLPSAKTKFGTVYFLPKVYNKNMALKCTGAASLRQTEGAVIVLQYADAKVGDAAEVNVKEFLQIVPPKEDLAGAEAVTVKAVPLTGELINLKVRNLFLKTAFWLGRTERIIAIAGCSFGKKLKADFLRLISRFLPNKHPLPERQDEKSKLADQVEGEEERETALIEIREISVDKKQE